MSSQLVLLSGGLDSAANLAISSQKGAPKLALHFDYGQRAFSKELHAARWFTEHYGLELRVFNLDFIKDHGLSKDNLPRFEQAELDTPSKTRESAKQVWVPNRNGVFVEIAASIAEAEGIKEILIGFNREEAATFPDNSEEYLDAINRSLLFSTQGRVQVNSYTLRMDKTEIVRALKDLERPFDFDRVWSCYDGGEVACGVCESCARFRRAMDQGGKR